jgi:hypothetical protein
LFEDLGITIGDNKDEEVYASTVVVGINNKINTYMNELGYKPPRMIYEPVTGQQPGLYNSS